MAGPWLIAGRWFSSCFSGKHGWIACLETSEWIRRTQSRVGSHHFRQLHRASLRLVEERRKTKDAKRNHKRQEKNPLDWPHITAEKEGSGQCTFRQRGRGCLGESAGDAGQNGFQKVGLGTLARYRSNLFIVPVETDHGIVEPESDLTCLRLDLGNKSLFPIPCKNIRKSLPKRNGSDEWAILQPIWIGTLNRLRQTFESGKRTKEII